MKERVLVKYYYQNDAHDKTHNCFFVLKDSDRALKVVDLLAQFPGLKQKEYGDKGYHFRFLDKLGKMQCWVDIRNPLAAVPITKNIVEMKVLVMPSQYNSTLFATLEKDIRKRSEKTAQESKEASKKPEGNGKPAQKPKANPYEQNIDYVDDITLDMSPPKPKKTQDKAPHEEKKPNQKKQDVGGEMDDFDILNDDNHAPPTTSESNGGWDESKVSEMFGDDFNPQERNRVLEVIQIGEKQKESAKSNMDRIKDNERKALELQQAKLEAGQTIEPQVKAWAFASNGTRNNIRVLLTTMNSIMWEGSGWTGVTLADLVSDGHVKRQYMKAIMKVHTDHNGDVTDPSQLYLMDRVFNILNDAYTEFTKNK